MRIYLDTKDLINVLENSGPCTADDFENFLTRDGHHIVLSSMNVFELSKPLLHRNAKTNVMRLLIRIEKMPRTFIHASNIPRLELEQAIHAFTKGVEYRDIDPYVKRFDETVVLNGQPPTKPYLNYGLWEIVWDLWSYRALEDDGRHANQLRHVFALDRNLSVKPSLKENFVKTIERNLSLHRINVPFHEIEPFAHWVFEDPKRCPSERFGYELFHKMIKNVQDVPKDSDMEDLYHTGCLPYVDLMTVDRRFRSYISQAAKGLGISYDDKIVESVKHILQQADDS